jgi:hypothetical protein
LAAFLFDSNYGQQEKCHLEWEEHGKHLQKWKIKSKNEKMKTILEIVKLLLWSHLTFLLWEWDKGHGRNK